MSLFQALPSWTPSAGAVRGRRLFFPCLERNCSFFLPGTSELKPPVSGLIFFQLQRVRIIRGSGREPIQQKRDEFPSERRAPVQTDGRLLLSLARVSARLEMCRTLPGKSEQPLALRRQIKVGRARPLMPETRQDATSAQSGGERLRSQAQACGATSRRRRAAWRR